MSILKYTNIQLYKTRLIEFLFKPFYICIYIFILFLFFLLLHLIFNWSFVFCPCLRCATFALAFTQELTTGRSAIITTVAFVCFVFLFLFEHLLPLLPFVRCLCYYYKFCALARLCSRAIPQCTYNCPRTASLAMPRPSHKQG